MEMRDPKFEWKMSINSMVPVPLPSVTVWDEESPDDDPGPLTRNLAYRGIGRRCNPKLSLQHQHKDHWVTMACIILF